MRVLRSDNISQVEWRWVTFWGGFLILLTLIPYAWAIIATRDGWHFFGILAAPVEGASYLSKIRQGVNGSWLWEIHHTPDTHDSAAFFVFYLALGQIARLFGFSSIVIYHLARIATSMLMFAAYYQLGATIWQRLRPRRLFFWLAIVGSGLGWLLVVLSQERLAPDLFVAEAFPLFAAFTNPHFPLSIAMLALITAIYLQVLRPGYTEAPRADNGGLNLIIFTIVLTIVQPSALFILGGAMTIFIIVTGYHMRGVPWHELRWFSMLFLPATPFIAYYLLVLANNDVMREYNEQYISPVPNLSLLLVAYGVLLLLALPAIYHAVRQFDRDGDQLMLIWLVFNAIAIYFPNGLHSRFLVGLTIPMVYFAVRAIEGYWLDIIDRKWHTAAIVALFVGIIPSNILVMVLPVYAVQEDPQLGMQASFLLEDSYMPMFDWLETNGQDDEVVLATPLTSVWIPAETDTRVVFGHPFETINADSRRRDVEDFYTGRNCNRVFDQDYMIDYVVWGPREIDLATDPDSGGVPDESCLQPVAEAASLILEFDEGRVTLYVLRPPR